MPWGGDDGRREEWLKLARKYVWWQTPEEACRDPDRVIVQVMTLGVFRDVRWMVEVLGEERLRAVIRRAKGGQFDPRSWAYWNYTLGLARPGALPPVPQKRIL